MVPKVLTPVATSLALMNGDEAPAVFLWRHQLAWGLSKSIDYAPEVNGYIYGAKIHVLGGKAK